MSRAPRFPVMRPLATVLSGAILAACNSGGPPAVNGPLIANPAIAYVVSQTDYPLEDPVFVLDFWDESAYSLFGGEEPAVAGGAEPTSGLGETTPLATFGSLDDATRSAVDTALGSLGPAEYVASVEEAQDTSGGDHLGCYPLREGATMITLGTPLQPFVPADEVNAQLLVSVGLTHDCSGAIWLLQLTWNGAAYETDVIRSSFWMV